MKQCTKCGELKPLAEFSRAKLGRDGRAAECKVCHRARADLKNRPLERSKAKQSGSSRYFTGRPCSNGHIAERYINGNCVECVKLGKTLYPEDPARKQQRKKRWDNENSEHRRAYNERTREHQREYRRQYRLNNEKEQARVREYRDRKRLTYRYYNAVRRFRKSRPRWIDQKAIKAIYMACPPDMHVDHIVPLNGFTVEGYQVCGLHVPWNLQYLPITENLRKNRWMR